MDMTVALDPKQILSLPNGPHPIDPEHQDKLCFCDDGKLYINAAARMDVYVMSYRERLKHKGINFEPVYVPLSELRDLYANSNTVALSGQVRESERQDQVIRLCRKAVSLGATDIHLIVMKRLTLVLMRIHGELEEVEGFNEYSVQMGQELCATIYNSMTDVSEPQYNNNIRQDARLGKEWVEGLGLYGARIATGPTASGTFMAVRLLYNAKNRKQTLEDFGYLDMQIAMINRMEALVQGVNIFSGVTGSGKSTAMAHVLDSMLKRFDYRINLITVEDPPEYEIYRGNQMPVNPNSDAPAVIAAAWANTISAAMRYDPDVLMVGEMRDAASAITAIQFALTGHGVWTTLHAKDAISNMDRLVQMGVPLDMITDASLLTGFINQTLVPLLCPDCKKPLSEHKQLLSNDLVERLEKHCQVGNVFLRGDGCPTCRIEGTKAHGHKDRTVIAEVLMPNQKFMEVYREGRAAAARAYWITEMQGVTKNQHLIARINAGLIDPRVGEQTVCSLDYDELTMKGL